MVSIFPRNSSIGDTFTVKPERRARARAPCELLSLYYYPDIKSDLERRRAGKSHFSLVLPQFHAQTRRRRDEHSKVHLDDTVFLILPELY